MLSIPASVLVLCECTCFILMIKLWGWRFLTASESRVGAQSHSGQRLKAWGRGDCGQEDTACMASGTCPLPLLAGTRIRIVMILSLKITLPKLCFSPLESLCPWLTAGAAWNRAPLDPSKGMRPQLHIAATSWGPDHSLPTPCLLAWGPGVGAREAGRAEMAVALPEGS